MYALTMHLSILDDFLLHEKVYDIANNPEGKISVALSKDVFANKILNDDRLTTGFDFEQFRKIFDIIEKVIMQSISLYIYCATIRTKQFDTMRNIVYNKITKGAK